MVNGTRKERENVEKIEDAARRLLEKLGERNKPTAEGAVRCGFADGVDAGYRTEKRPPATNADSILGKFTMRLKATNHPATRVGIVAKYAEPDNVLRFAPNSNRQDEDDWLWEI